MASVCAPFGIHLEPINKELILLYVGANVIIINCATGPKRELCSAKKKKLFGLMVCHMSLSKTLLNIHSAFIV